MIKKKVLTIKVLNEVNVQMTQQTENRKLFLNKIL